MQRGADKFVKAYRSGFRLDLPDFWPEQSQPPARKLPRNPYKEDHAQGPARSAKTGPTSALEAIFCVTSRETKASIFGMFIRFLASFGVVPLEKLVGQNATAPQRQWHLAHIEAFCGIYAAAEAASTTVLQYASVVFATLEMTSALFEDGHHRTMTFFRNVRSIAGQTLPTRAKVLTFNGLCACPLEVRRLMIFWVLSGLRRVSLLALLPGDVTRSAQEICVQVGSSKVENVRRMISIRCNCEPDARGATACLFHGLPGLSPVPDIPVNSKWLDAIMTKLGIAFHSARRTLVVAIFNALEHVVTHAAVTALNRHMLWSNQSMMCFQYGFDATDFESTWLFPVRSVLSQFEKLQKEGKSKSASKVHASVKIKALSELLSVLDDTDEDHRELKERIEKLRVSAADSATAPPLTVPYMEVPLIPARPNRTTVGQARPAPFLRNALQYHSEGFRGPSSATPKAAPKKRGRPPKAR